jgi:hypothetical protein
MTDCSRKVTRIIMKRSSISGVKPTIPPSEDHTDGSWISTDIYKGEFFFNQADGIIYTRSSDGIIVIGGGYTGEVLEYEAIMNQSGTGNPTAYVYKNTIGSIVWARTDKGKYTGTLVGSFPQYRTGLIFGQDFAVVTRFKRLSDDVVEIRTYDSALALADSGLVETYIKIIVFPELPAS